jgi:hypothetical protein
MSFGAKFLRDAGRQIKLSVTLIAVSREKFKKLTL